MTVIHGAAFANRAEPPSSVLGCALPGACHTFYGIGLLSAVIIVLALTGSLFMLQVYDRPLPSHSMLTLVALTHFTGALFVFYGLKPLIDQRQRATLNAPQTRRFK
jgi:ABC-type protease/lipase transport system fused ATPase/permease subunit